jgi:hypothetical protein
MSPRKFIPVTALGTHDDMTVALSWHQEIKKSEQIHIQTGLGEMKTNTVTQETAGT